MRLMEESQNAVAALTGMKTQFIENGWSEIGAEQAVIAMLQQSNMKN